MTVYFNKQRNRWMYNFQRNGIRYASYCLDATGQPVTSEKAAEQAEAIEIRRAETAPKVGRASDLTLARVVRDLIPQWETEADWPNKERYIREILAYFGADRAVCTISEADLEDYRTWARQQPVMIWVGGSNKKRSAALNFDDTRYWKKAGQRSSATVNRYLALVRLILGRAHRVRDPLTNARAIEDVPKVTDLPERKRKARPIPDEVLTFIMEAGPQYVREATVATLFFGFRQGEIFELNTTDVDLELGGIWLSGEDTKDDEDAFQPGAPEAMAYMAGLVEQAKARGVQHVIAWRPYRRDPVAQEKEAWRPLKRPKTAWRRIMLAVEKQFGRKYRWHDIRAAFITHVALTSGGPAAKDLARHSDYRTTEAYIHVADDVRQRAATRAAKRPALSVIPGGKSQTGVANKEVRSRMKAG